MKNKIYIFRSKPDLYLNFDNSDDKFILLTGLSGSGKSSLAVKLVREQQYDKVSFDLVFFGGIRDEITDFEKNLILEFKKKYPEWKQELFTKNSANDKCVFFYWANLFYDFIIDFFNTNNKPILIEGTQIYKYICVDKIVNKRLIIKRTSFVKSCYRRIKRTIIILNNDLRMKKISFNTYLERFFVWIKRATINQFGYRKIINNFINNVC